MSRMRTKTSITAAMFGCMASGILISPSLAQSPSSISSRAVVLHAARVGTTGGFEICQPPVPRPGRFKTGHRGDHRGPNRDLLQAAMIP